MLCAHCGLRPLGFCLLLEPYVSHEGTLSGPSSRPQRLSEPPVLLVGLWWVFGCVPLLFLKLRGSWILSQNVDLLFSLHDTWLVSQEEGGVGKVGFRVTQLSPHGGDSPLLGIALPRGMGPSWSRGPSEELWLQQAECSRWAVPRQLSSGFG